ncbi:MAG: oxidoreductase [Fulvivirga sp.]
MNSEQLNRKQINVGLIGYGMGGRVFHAPLIHHVEGLHLSMIRETRPENIKIANSRYPEAEIVAEASDVIHHRDIDLVVLAVPNKFHYALAKEALEAGKHVVVEKPFTVTSREAEELILLAQKYGKMLTVFHNRRWDSDFLTVKKVIQSEMVGRLVAYESHYDRFRNTLRPNSWKEEGSLGTGLLYDLGSHIIDQAQVLFGLPEAVTGFTAAQRDNSSIVDSFEIILHYPNLQVTLKSGMLVKEPLPKYIVSGTEGSFVKYGLDVQEEALNKGELSLADETWGLELDKNWGTLNTGYKGLNLRGTVESERGNYAAFYENVCAVIRDEEPLQVTAEQAKNTIRIIELAMQSSEEQRTMIFRI